MITITEESATKLEKVLDWLAGEGYEILGIDIADLYLELFEVPDLE